MPIKRAGPFASYSDSFLDEPTSVTPFVLPVNCAKSYSPTWPFKGYVLEIVDPVVIREGYFTEPSVEILSEGYEATGDLRFYYQAAAATTIEVEYNITVSNSSNQSVMAHFRAYVGGSLEYDDSDSGISIGGVGGTISLNLPEAVVPMLVKLSGYAYGGGLEIDIFLNDLTPA